MTEAEWLVCEDPALLLANLVRRASNRKNRLLAVAFCRRIEHLMAPERGARLLAEAHRFGVFHGEYRPGPPSCLLQAIADAEACADELLPASQLVTTSVLADRLHAVGRFSFDCYDDSWGVVDCDLLATCEAAGAIYHATRERFDVWEVATHTGRAIRRSQGNTESDDGDPSETSLCGLIRDAFPFLKQSLSFTPEWRTDTAVALAAQMYESRDFSSMPILADALQDAGCDNDAILSHCRGEGPHVRGCWVVDLVLDRE